VEQREQPGREARKPNGPLPTHRHSPRMPRIRTRVTAEAAVGGVIGPRDSPDVLILGRLDDYGRLRAGGWTIRLSVGLRAELGAGP
jgi:hypothetical protein